MAEKKFSMDDYVDVAERIQDFKDAHPTGTLQRVGNPEVMEFGEQRFVVYTAAAYRDPDDERPGIGTAWEPIPGKTPYTRDSELMNAETAAWGRAIIALGLVANRKLASRQEVRARVEDQASEKEQKKGAPKPKPEWTPSPAALEGFWNLYLKSGLGAEKPDNAPDDFDPHIALRMLLASHGAGNAGYIEACIAALDRKQFEAVWTAVEESGQ